MGGRGASYQRKQGGGQKPTSSGANFASVTEAQKAINNLGFFDKYATLMTYDFTDPNDLGTPAVEVRTANAIYDMVKKIGDMFPEIKGMVRSLSPEKIDENGVLAHCHMRGGEVNINTRYFNNLEELAQSCEVSVKSGFHPQGTENPASIVAHEIGHAIDGYLTVKKNLYGYTPGGNYKYVSSVMRPKVMKAAGLKVTDVGKHVSRYAETNAKEWFAESFSEYVSSSNPRPAAKAFGEELKRILKSL